MQGSAASREADPASDDPASNPPTSTIEAAGLRCAVRPVCPADAAAFTQHLNNRAVSRWLRDRVPFPYTIHHAHQFVQAVASQHPPCHFAIVVDGEAVGVVGLEPQEDVYRRSAELGFWLGERYWGRGIASEAAAAVIDHAFASQPHLHRIFSRCFAGNAGSQALLRRLGFRQEGCSRQAAFKEGQFLDEFTFGLLRPEWQQQARQAPQGAHAGEA